MSNEKGFTLIELLAGLLLFSIVSVAAVSLTVQAMHNNTNAEATNSLRNDATYVTQVLRTAYENGNLDGMCLNKEEENILRSKSDEIIKLQLNDNKLSAIEFSYKGSDPSKPNCFNSQSEVKTLQVNFTISHKNNNEENETFDVDTAFSKPTKDELTVSLVKPDEGSAVIEKCKILEKQIITDTNNDQYSKGLQFTGDTTSSLWQFDLNNHRSVKVTDGSMTVTHSTSINDIPFKVDQSLKVNGELSLYNTADTNIGKQTYTQNGLGLFSKSSLETTSLTVSKKLQAQNQSVLMVHGNVETGEGAHFFTESSGCVGGDAYLKGNSEFQNFSTFHIAGNLEATNLNLLSKAELYVGKDTLISGNIYFQRETKFEIGGNVLVNGDLTATNGSLYVKGNLKVLGNLDIHTPVKIIAEGDITIEGSSGPNWSKATICAGGDIRIKNNNGKDMIIKENHKCQK
ncbi:prepilin-type N-terminal cleavage/methylation domain-containing protein [Terribacillus sp. DMT04]|uniref:prepilin-type N-terminal cleavage/methylation domain-containing protein n=1 Tax=Terribacillus sp. DMT04 TaxID=2850441 RepID=UPI001C2BC27B|nr:prepilin-type N-terminal cleavage/methylation domain-containing protein [Terribacillus sp. DMT04]QXE00569.1 FapA family protein [Terribacillus sp. DMT04]